MGKKWQCQNYLHCLVILLVDSGNLETVVVYTSALIMLYDKWDYGVKCSKPVRLARDN